MMTPQEIDRIQCAIRHIQTAADVDPWAVEIAVDAMQKQIPKKTQKDLQPTCNNLATDCISRQAAIDAILAVTGNSSVRELYEHVQEHGLSEMWSGGVNAAIDTIIAVPSAQPELTDDRAIEHLQSTGWMQNHDKEMYEMGLRERLADDSDSYDSLIPCEDAISRRAAIDALKRNTFRLTFAEEQNCEGHVAWSAEAVYSEVMEGELLDLPSAQPEHSNASKFWRKRADFYSDMCMNLIGEMGKGVKIESVKISENGIEFIKEQPPAQPERKTGKWIGKSGSLHYCSECGWALMDNESGEPPYMGIDYHRENPERWTCCPGWNEWLMNFCPNCGADMRGGQE